MKNPLKPRDADRPFAHAPRREVDDELAFHLEARIKEYVARGMTPDEARREAERRFGDVGQVRDECTTLLAEERAARARRDWLGDLRMDLRFGLRAALRAPLFTLLAIVTLALGIGANAAVFGVLKSVLIDALPYGDADRIVRIYSRMKDGTNDKSSTSPAAVTDIMTRQRSFASAAYFMRTPGEAIFAGEGGQAEVVKVEWASPDLLKTLGVAVAAGRPLRADDVADTVRSVLVTHPAWQRLFAGDAGVVGRTITINGITRTVVGILPRGFVGPAGETDFYYPLGLAPYLADPVGARGSHWLGFVARVKPGLDVAAARGDVAAIGAALGREYPRDDGNLELTTTPIRDDMVGDTRMPLLILMGSAGLVLLITCANLGGALLSRTITRRKEFAVRVALGAGSGRLVRQLLAESIVLALMGGIAGVALAALGLAVLRGVAAQALPAYARLTLDPGALAFTFLLALVAGLAFGLFPALAVRRADPQRTLRDESRGASESRRSRTLRGLLVAGQIAICISLLAGAGLLVRSLMAMTSAPVGLETKGVLDVIVRLPNGSYRTPDAIVQFYDALEQRLRAVPGVTAVADAAEPPTAIGNQNGVTIVGRPVVQDAIPFILYTAVSDDYFKALGIPLVAGRTFNTEDRAGTAPTMVISQAMAKRFWPKGDALGAQLRQGPNPNAAPYTVVGIVGDVRNDLTRADAEPAMYGSARRDMRLSRHLLVRTGGDPMAVLPVVRREVAAIDPGAPLRDPKPLQQIVDEHLTGRRLPVLLMTAFGVLALLLASVGVYALFANMAAAREREFGVRIALGSSPRSIAALVLRQGSAWLLAGLAAGAIGVVFVGRLIRGLLYGVPPFDPIALGAAVLMLVTCAVVALVVPVRRATRVDPATLLR